MGILELAFLFVFVITTARSSNLTAKRALCEYGTTGITCCEKRYDDEYPCDATGFELIEKSGTCLMFITSVEPWDLAHSTCYYQHDSHMVTILTREMDRDIAIEAQRSKGSFWLGLHNRHLKKRLGLNAFGWLQDKHEVRRRYHFSGHMFKTRTFSAHCSHYNRGSYG
ncbi:hypothetical protein ElyMa_003438300 [Elysia marginata]|uniref:C-type lectin domain-containing protein n=1 Tax=Elysia marginata TaxID=1093978 RepID=A0AAV4JSM5_9GAST|nr:hypothetical protein ElyMa_003438300 [Elysia marginata]